MSKNKININLGGILDDTSFAYEKELGLNRDRIEEIDIDMIRVNPYQPRKNFDENLIDELACSIKNYGMLQPIVVIYDENSVDGGYILIAGERRLRACKKLGFKLIKAYVGKFSVDKLLELALIENIQRENLNPIELAVSYETLLKHYNITQDELSKVVNKSRTQVTNTLRMLSLTDETKSLIEKGVITQGHAKVIVGLDKDIEKKVVSSILGQKLSVKATEKLVKKLKSGKSDLNKVVENFGDNKNYISANNVIKILKQNGIKCKIKMNEIIIDIHSAEDLLNVINKKQTKVFF